MSRTRSGFGFQDSRSSEGGPHTGQAAGRHPGTLALFPESGLLSGPTVCCYRRTLRQVYGPCPALLAVDPGSLYRVLGGLQEGRSGTVCRQMLRASLESPACLHTVLREWRYGPRCLYMVPLLPYLSPC